MQKQFLAAVVASVVAGQAMAVTVVDDGTNKFTIGGHVGIRAVASKTGDAGSSLQSAGDSSRFNFQFESKLSEDMTAFARGEWGFDVTKHGGDFAFSNRLGFVGVRHADFGSISVGQQWSAFSQIANWTDTFATADGGLGMYDTEGGAFGTSRANEALQYNLSVDGLNIGLQYQPGQSYSPTDAYTRKHGYQFAVSYDLPMGVSAGITYNQAQFAQNDVEDAKALVMAVKYDQGPVYAAFSYGHYKNHAEIHKAEEAAEKARGFEFVGGYQLSENWSVQSGIVHLKDSNDSGTKKQNVPVEVVYTTGPIQLSGTYTFEQSKTEGAQHEKDRFVAQARYYF